MRWWSKKRSKTPGQTLVEFALVLPIILMIMFAPNSQALATFDGGSIKIWDMPKKNDVDRL